MIKVGLFGFGRIGRAITRQLLDSSQFDISFICDANPSLENVCYLLKYDSTYGKLNKKLINEENRIIINDSKFVIRYYKKEEFNLIDYKNIDLLIDATGSKQLSEELEKIISNKKLKLIQTNSSDKNSKKIIFGVNENDSEYKKDLKICSSTCDANGCATILKAISSFNEIEYGNITIMHPWSNYQNLIDGPSMMYSEINKIYNNYSLGRTAPDNLIPRNTSCIDALSEIWPSFKGKFNGMCIRVPTSIVCGATLHLKLTHKSSVEQFHNLLLESDQSKNNLLKLESEQLISKDFLGTNKNVHLDSRWTEINSYNLVRVFIWYDNEWGYSANVLRLAKHYIG